MRTRRVATPAELGGAVRRYGPDDAPRALRAHGLIPPMMGAAGLAIDASTPAFVGTASGTANSQTTASFTPPLGALLVVMLVDASGGSSMIKPTNTGGAVTWDAAVKVSENANGVSGGIWFGTVTTSASMTVTEAPNSGTSIGVGVVVVTGQAATQNGQTGVATSASGTPSASLGGSGTVGANSLILGCVADTSNADTPTIPAGQSDSFNGQTFAYTNSGGNAGWCQYLTGMNLAAGSSARINDTAPTGVIYSIAMVEILADTGGVAGQTFVPHAMPLGV